MARTLQATGLSALTSVSAVAGILALLALTVILGAYGLRISRSTSDFYVASRTARPWWNAPAIGGEYLASASYLGVAGLILTAGTDAFWIPIGYTGGFLILLLFVAAPLRRSNAYTIPDFAEARLGSKAARRVTSAVTILICGTYVVPQLHGAALTVGITTGLPAWTGPVAVAGVVGLVTVSGGMRSITFVQGIQFWIKVAALVLPLFFMIVVLLGQDAGMADVQAGMRPLPTDEPPVSGYRNVSLLIGLLLGTVGLPHILVRFYTSPDGRTARRTAVIVIALVGTFYFLPFAYGTLARAYAPELARNGEAAAAVLLLPGHIVNGAAGELLTALVAAGAFSAFVATTSGLIVSLAGIVSQEFFGSGVGGFRLSAGLTAGATLALAVFTESASLVETVGLVFAFSAATICPLLILGIWWRPLTPAGAIAGIVTGGSLVLLSVLAHQATGGPGGIWTDLLAQPAAWAVSASFIVMVAVSKRTIVGRPADVDRFLDRIHTPERD